MDDLWNAPCAAPQGELRRQERPFTKKHEEMLAKAVEASVKLVERLGTPVLWAGEEIERNRLERELVSLVQLTGIPFCTTVGAKSVVSENTPGFTGVYNGKASLPEVRKAFMAAGCRIGLGTWSTSKNLGGEKSIGDDWIVAAREGVSVGAQYFPDVQLARFVPALRDALGVAFGKRAFETDLYALAHAKDRQVPANTIAFLTGLSGTDYPEELTYDGFFQHMNAFLLSQAQGDGPEATSPFTVVSDAAFALLGSMNLRMAERASFVAQNSWLSIGYSVGAATGVALGRQQPLKRPLVFVGDGSFQEICQELSTHVRHHLRPVVFVLDNEGFYGIEQMLVSPCYYKEKPSDGADFYNVLHSWQYEKLAEVFGSEKDRMHGRELTTHTQLESLLLDIADPGNDINRAPILARVRLSRHDYPRALQYKIDEKCK